MTESRSEFDQLVATPKGALDQASAKVVNAVGGLMQRALAATGTAKQDIAKAMLVSPGRISQILAADGNVKVSTLARFMEACGYELSISAVPKREGLPSLEPRRRGPRRVRTAPASSARFHVDDYFGPKDFASKPGIAEHVQLRAGIDESFVIDAHFVPNVVLWSEGTNYDCGWKGSNVIYLMDSDSIVRPGIASLRHDNRGVDA